MEDRSIAGRWTIRRIIMVTMPRLIVVSLMVVALASVSHAQSAARKCGRGLAGMTTAFLEVPGNMVAETRKHGAGEGVPLGFAIGLGMIVPRVLVGVYEFVGAPFPVPEGYQPILQPEYPWSYFEDRGQRVAEAPVPHRGKTVAKADN